MARVVASAVFLLGVGCLLGASAQECGGELTDPFGSIASPRYPDPYPPGSNCHWEIQAPPTRKIYLSFDDFFLESSVDCFPGDYLTVTDPEGDSFILCGQDHPKIIESVGNVLYINFVSDADDERGFGFRLTYVNVSKCEDGWAEFGEHCYFFSEVAMNFTDSQADCEARNAQLASIHSREEQLFVQRHSRKGTLRIGAIGMISEGDVPYSFEFVDGSPADYDNLWQPVEQSPLECSVLINYTCGLHLAPDRWVNRDCSENKPVVCKSLEAHSGEWRCYGDLVCFHVSPRSFNFQEARSYCLEFPETDILVILVEEQNPLAYFFEGITPPESNEIWIGLQRPVSGDWEWVDGSPWNVDRWEAGHPTASGGDCAAASTSSWDDQGMHVPLPFVCKKLP